VAAPGAKGRTLSSDEQVSQWIEGPIGSIPLEQARTILESNRYALNEVELGANRASCDWEFESRKEGFSLFLPEIQEMRSLARLAALKVRVAIRDGKTDEAMHWVQIGLVMGRHVAEGPIAIQALVGVAINSVMLKCLEELIRTPGTPSLYWALADSPRPFIDVRYAIEGERYAIEKELPVLREAEGDPWSLEQARRHADQLQSKLLRFFDGEPIPFTSTRLPSNMSNLARQLGVAAMASKIYPTARRTLIAAGRPEALVEAMPVVQVSLLYTVLEYRRNLDQRFKWINLPYWQSYSEVDRVTKATVQEKLANPLLAMLEALTPALNGIRLAAFRLDRQLNALQCIEAIRIYASRHEGRFPATLEQLTDTPPPVDPLTGKPFTYEENGYEATLSAPAPPGGPDHPSYKIHYVLKFAK
jgi:hypothetical protein